MYHLKYCVPIPLIFLLHCSKGHWLGVDQNQQHFAPLLHQQQQQQQQQQQHIMQQQILHQGSNTGVQQQQQQQQQQGKHNPPDHSHFPLDYNSAPLLRHHHHHHQQQQQQSGIMQHQSLQQYQQPDFSSLSPGWDQCMSTDGEMYFVNQLDNTAIPYDHRMCKW